MERIRTTKPQRLARPAGPSVGMSMGYGKTASASPGASEPPETIERQGRGVIKTTIVAGLMTVVVAGVGILIGLPLIRAAQPDEPQSNSPRAASPYRDFQPSSRGPGMHAAPSMSSKVHSLKAGGGQAQETALQRAAECRYRSPIFVHRVQVDESLGEVAGAYGVRVRDLLRLNPGLKKDRDPAVGTTVRVCPELPPRRKEMTSYQSSGESWARIAARYEIPESVLRRANPNVDGIESPAPEAGQTLAVPRQGSIVPGFPTGEGSEHEGALHNGVRLPTSPQYEIKRPALNYGSPQTIASVRRIAQGYWDKSRGHKLLIGDLSRRGGGPLTGHRSHQQGRDIDIGIPLRMGERYDRFVTATGQNLHHERTWLLVKEILADPNLAFIFVDMSVQAELYNYALRKGESEAFLREVFQYPRVSRDRYGVIRHFRGHIDHFHIRFRE